MVGCISAAQPTPRSGTPACVREPAACSAADRTHEAVKRRGRRTMRRIGHASKPPGRCAPGAGADGVGGGGGRQPSVTPSNPTPSATAPETRT